MKLILIPSGGLANRMRAMDSAVNMQKERHCSLSVLWYQDWGMGCGFSDIFEPVNFVKDKDKPSKILRIILKLLESSSSSVRCCLNCLSSLHIFKWYPKEDMDGQREFASSFGKQYLIVLMESWEYFYEKEIFNTECFRLKDNEAFLNLTSCINSYTVGVHIRRADNRWSVENSSLDVFEEAMRKEYVANSGTNFLLCSDDEGVKSHFREDAFWKCKVIIPTGEICRGTLSGMQQAAGELYALSRTRKILGSYWSSFSEVAAKIGGIKLKVVRND